MDAIAKGKKRKKMAKDTYADEDSKQVGGITEKQEKNQPLKSREEKILTKSP